MDFRFQSIVQQSSMRSSPPPYLPLSLPPPSPSTSTCNFSFSTHQPTIAGSTAPELGYRDFGRNPEEFREAQFQRELEKERIRAEIISQEIMRRRVLEEEVRREIMIEREMQIAARFGASKPMWLEPRPSMLTNYLNRTSFGAIGVSAYCETGFRGLETLPFRRGATASEVANGNESRASLSVNVPEIKAASPFGSEVNKGKVILLAKPTITTVADFKRKAAVQPDVATDMLRSSSSKKQKTNDEWSCALCRISVTCEQGLNEHLRGRKHLAREKSLISQKVGFGTTAPNKTIVRNSKHVKAPGSEISQTTKIKEKSHKKSQKKMSSVGKKENQKRSMKRKNTTASAKPKKFKFWCELCKVGAYCQTVMDHHMKGKKHSTTILEAVQTGELKTILDKTSTKNVEIALQKLETTSGKISAVIVKTENTKQEIAVGEEEVKTEQRGIENNPMTTDV